MSVPLNCAFGEYVAVFPLIVTVALLTSIVEKVKEGSQKGLTNQNLAQFVGEYVKRLSDGVKH